MPPPEEEEKKPTPRPKEKPKPPKPKHKTGPEPKPRQEHAESHWTPGGGVGAAGALPPDPLSCGDSCSGPCGFLPHCSEPPPAPPATVHIRSSRLPTPLIALSASLLVFSAALLVALLVHRLVRRRRRQRRLARAAAAAGHGDEEEGGQHQVLAGAVAEAVSDGEEDADGGGGGGVHHVWYIRTKGLDERAIAAIAAVVYDAKKRGAGAVDDGGGCAVCLAEFSDGETLRLLPRCGHAFHRGCIDTWLRAHVNCPLCRAPVQVAAAAAAAAATATAAPGGDQPERNLGVPRRTDEDAERGGGLMPERAVRRAASMVALPRRAWPDVSSLRAPASSSGREGDMTGLGKIMRLLKFPDAMEMAGMGAGSGRSVSFSAGSCQQGLPTRSDEPSAAGVSSDEAPQ